MTRKQINVHRDDSGIRVSVGEHEVAINGDARVASLALDSLLERVAGFSKAEAFTAICANGAFPQ